MKILFVLLAVLALVESRRRRHTKRRNDCAEESKQGAECDSDGDKTADGRCCKLNSDRRMRRVRRMRRRELLCLKGATDDAAYKPDENEEATYNC